MFYADNLDKMLRFGDVVKGYVCSSADLKYPVLSPEQNHDYKVNVEIPVYSVILTPCCSIEEGKVSLTPLIKVSTTFFKNPYFAEDLTRINREMDPEQTVPQETWDSFAPQEKERRLNEGRSYALLPYFIYNENAIFEKYTVRGDNIGYYMIDFRNIYTVKCQLIKKVDNGRSAEDSLIQSKLLQLTNDVRSELRDKITKYYSRIPIEESILED